MHCAVHVAENFGLWRLRETNRGKREFQGGVKNRGGNKNDEDSSGVSKNRSRGNLENGAGHSGMEEEGSDSGLADGDVVVGIKTSAQHEVVAEGRPLPIPFKVGLHYCRGQVQVMQPPSLSDQLIDSEPVVRPLRHGDAAP